MLCWLRNNAQTVLWHPCERRSVYAMYQKGPPLGGAVCNCTYFRFQ